MRKRRFGETFVFVDADVSPGVEVAKMVVIVDVEDYDVGGRLLFFFEHSQVGLIDGPSADAEVADRLLEVGCEDFLPGLAVAYLVALSKAIAVGVDSAREVGVVDSLAWSVVWFVGVF